MVLIRELLQKCNANLNVARSLSRSGVARSIFKAPAILFLAGLLNITDLQDVKAQDIVFNWDTGSA